MEFAQQACGAQHRAALRALTMLPRMHEVHICASSCVCTHHYVRVMCAIPRLHVCLQVLSEAPWLKAQDYAATLWSKAVITQITLKLTKGKLVWNESTTYLSQFPAL